MDFFLMSQDMDFQNIVSIRREEIPETWRSTRGIERRHYPSAKDFLGKNCNILVESNRQNLYPDFLEFPVPLLSTTLKDVFISYVPGLPCSCVLLSDQKERQQHTYWVFEVECLDCLADGTEYYPDGTWKKMVLDEKRIGAKAIFRVNGTVQKPIMIRRDVAESILRRSMLGIKLECVEAERLQSG